MTDQWTDTQSELIDSAELAALRARLAECEAALAPFAGVNPDWLALAGDDLKSVDIRVTLGDLRRAARALEGGAAAAGEKFS